MSRTDDESALFENEVRRIARQLWPEAEYCGAKMIQGRERDGVFETEDCIHLIEATTARSKEKAVTDSQKLSDLAKAIRPRDTQKAVKCWFVTRDEPTADQRVAIEKHRGLVTPLSFSQFQAKLIDAKTYLTIRESYPFGSVRDPATGVAQAKLEYVPLDLVDSASAKLWNIAEIRAALLAGTGFVLLGDYGAGKSMTLRELHKELRGEFFNNHTTKFPIYLNLRDHFGQTNPAEVLERHARNVGFAHPSHLVRAWRAGYVILLLDGFDELTTAGIQGLWKRLQDTRFRAMQAVREFSRNKPPGCGVILAGRAHFFDTDSERRNALGIHGSFVELKLNEFTDEQIQRYLERRGLRGTVPAWLPSRPLLVGYLAASGILEGSILGASGGSSPDPARGWDSMLDRICHREAEIEVGIDGSTVRQILERLATRARATSGGLGPLTRDQLGAAFVEICGYAPDEKGALLLQRLPGLGIERSDEETRTFIDESFADSCRAGDVNRYTTDPFNFGAAMFRGAEIGLGTLGIGMCSNKAHDNSLSAGKLGAAIQRASEPTAEINMLMVDLVRLAMELRFDIGTPVQINNVHIPVLEVTQDTANCSKLLFRDCYFTRLGIDPDVTGKHMPHFEDCYIDELDGRSSQADLPPGAFERCEFGNFSEAPSTTDAIGSMDLPTATKVLLSILRKIYLRSGTGRKENALHRGLDHRERRLVSPVLHLLQQEGLIAPYHRAGLDMTIWIPDRAKTARVAKIVTSPRECGDPLLQKAANIS